MPRILIAEDDPLVASALEKGLRANGFATELADDGVQAQRLSLMEEFDLMILDLGLPERDGYQVLRALRSRGRTLPVLVLTSASERDAAVSIEFGADEYMRKPFQFVDLLGRVRARLRAADEARREMSAEAEGQLRDPAREPGVQDPDR